MPRTTGPEPRLTTRDVDYKIGYGPRVVRLSRHRGYLFAGCKDGSAFRVDLGLAAHPDAEKARSAAVCLCVAGKTGVRSLCDLDNGWLLLGQDDGRLSLLRWDHVEPGGNKPTSVELPPGLPEDPGAFGYVGRWDEGVFIASPRRTAAFFLRLQGTSSSPDLVCGETLDGVMAMSGYARLGQESWIVCKTGALWCHGPGGLESWEHLWEDSGFERPGFVFDIAVVRINPDKPPDYGIYMSTDEGVFLLRRPPQEPAEKQGQPPFVLEAVYLPGITDTCMAIAHAVQGNHCFLWVSDVDGNVHLFRSDVNFWEAEGSSLQSPWKRSGLLERRWPVVRALASWEPGKKHEAVLGQACRDDRVVVSWYTSGEEASPAPDTEDETDAEILSWGDVRWLRKNLRDGDERHRELKKDWSLEALVADHIERTGADPEGLRKFLRNPQERFAVSVLREILREGPPERAGRSLTLWTHALLGTVHRRLENPATQDYLGIIRWLRRIGQSRELLALAREHGCEEDLRLSLDRNLQYARKWGVFGRTYAKRQSVLSALKPLLGQEGEERLFDRLVYESLLFRRRVDMTEGLPSPAPHSFAPWDLRHLSIEDEKGESVEYVAVSWADGGTLYQRRAGDPWEDLTKEVDASPELLPALGGRILLGNEVAGRKRRAFLISTPSPASTGGSSEIQLRFLDVKRKLFDAPASSLKVKELLDEKDPGKPESVYCLYSLGQGRVAVGLEGTSGAARFGIFEITRGGRLRALRPEDPLALSPIYPESKTRLHNPVWAFTSYPGPTRNETFLFVGCGDGQIWKLHLQFTSSGYRLRREAASFDRLGAPVTALACRAEKGNALRLFAGGADGTVVAFQTSDPSREDAHTTLWATQEEGPVRNLHVHQSFLVDPEGREGRKAGAERLVLAVTQPGMAVLILDRPTMETRQTGSLRRLRVPGERLGRFSLQHAAFSSVLLPGSEEGEFPELARLLVMPASGGPRLLTLYHPKLTPFRRSKFQELRRDWLERLQGKDGRVQGHLLRRPETTYVVAEALPAVLVRWILPFPPGEKSWEERILNEGPAGEGRKARQWLPRHLQPLVDLDTAWKAGESLNGRLEAALLAAHEVGDKALFKEILEAALSRANHELYEEALSPGGLSLERARNFEALMADLEKVKGVWEGSSGHLDSQMRITIAENLLDGDTLWSLSQSRSGFSEIAMNARIRLVHRSLGKGDSLLALETLHAANLALLRLCGRLKREPEQDWSTARPGEHFLPWDALRGFYQAVGDFAARVAHPKGNLGDVAAHEICRSYALGMLVCPPALVELAVWISEADLPADIGERIRQQVALLETLLGDRWQPLSGNLKDLIQISLGVGGSYKECLFFPVEKYTWFTERNLGRGNLETIRARKPFDDTIVWLHDLARQLTDEAGDVNLGRYRELKSEIDRVPDLFRHSRQFWQQAFEDLQKMCGGYGDLFATPGEGEEIGSRGVPFQPVRPELVLFSTALQDWCIRQRKKLQDDRARYSMFEPMTSMYDEALALVERAARRFRHGAGVQKNLVLGVMGHGLLELLDEHLLEVWEVAQALDPRRTWEQDQLGEGDGLPMPRRGAGAAVSTASRFAEYLLQRALKGEVIPKNLRSLQGLLSFAGRPEDEKLTLQDLLDEYAQWEVEKADILAEDLDSRTYHFLHLTLNELLQNDHMHGVPDRPAGGGPERKPRIAPRVRAGRSPEGEIELHFEFHYQAEDQEVVSRVYALLKSRLQTMMPAREDPRVPSHGTGLYLANLAAGAVGWKLEPAPAETGVLRFRLLKKAGDR